MPPWFGAERDRNETAFEWDRKVVPDKSVPFASRKLPSPNVAKPPARTPCPEPASVPYIQIPLPAPELLVF